MGRKYADSPKAIYEYMLKDPAYRDYHFVWFFKDRIMDEYLYLEEDERTELMLWGSPDYYRTYARAGYWITNSRVPKQIGIKDGQTYVQCWHGTPLKRLGFDIEVAASEARNTVQTVREVYENDASRYTYMVSPSRYCTEKFISAFNLKALGKEDIVIEEGYPRNDEIVNHTEADVKRIRESLGIPEEKKVILYAPTWRDNQHEQYIGYVYESPIDFAEMKKRFGDDYVVLFRAHYFIGNTFDFEEYNGFVIDACLYPEINDLYIISDILITDYSSVFFDYGILKRPEIFYMYDLEYYRDELRGFYISLDELPGPVIENQEALFDSIATVDEWFSTPEMKDKYEAFENKFTYLDDGHATERVVRRVFGAEYERLKDGE
ncbi:MAG: CDP-glycerol glycerophosphotransferase family protein [Mogibacterium sp.]|nr:CDP-glycerol glycerophosphotransferase family protein [Mogibacterium sp.]